MKQDVAEAERTVRELADLKERAERELKEAQDAAVSAREALAAAEEGAAGLGSDMADTVARQALELRKAATEQAIQAARQRVEAAAGAQNLVDAASRAEEEHRAQEAEVARARERRAEAAKAEQAANEVLRRCDLLDRGLEARAAERQAAGGGFGAGAGIGTVSSAFILHSSTLATLVPHNYVLVTSGSPNKFIASLCEGL
jgi:colicin import membrane protein